MKGSCFKIHSAIVICFSCEFHQVYICYRSFRQSLAVGESGWLGHVDIVRWIRRSSAKTIRRNDSIDGYDNTEYSVVTNEYVPHLCFSKHTYCHSGNELTDEHLDLGMRSILLKYIFAKDCLRNRSRWRSRSLSKPRHPQQTHCGFNLGRHDPASLLTLV